jgi:hypothetical protein
MNGPGSVRMSMALRLARPGIFALAVLGGLAGIATLWLHLTTDPLADVRAYYDAGARLNAGLPLYPADADPNSADFYRYPPLLAIAFRPLALLPFPVAAAIWEAIVIASLVGTLWWVGIRRRETWLAVGILGIPIAWCVAVGQAQVPLTFLTALGTPWSIALATNLKLFPALVALWWIGRRDRRAVVVFAAWILGLALVQLVLAPQATLDFLATLTLEQVGEVRNISPYALSPLLWAVLVVAGVVLALRLAPGRWGWAAAVALSVLATPRLLVYMLMTLVAAIRDPSRPAPGMAAAKGKADGTRRDSAR